MKLTITIEDADGGVVLSGEPSLDDLVERARTPDQCTSAEGYAMIAWIALRREADRAHREQLTATGGRVRH